MTTLKVTATPATGAAGGLEHTDLARAKILVVGASGFLGRPLVRRLTGLGAAVTAVSRNADAEEDGNAHWIAADASDAAQVARLFAQARPDLTYVLTSDSRGGQDLDFVQPSLQNDVMATINVLVEATRHGCGHVVMTGSLDEPDGLARSATPASPYGAAKWALGGYARMFMRLYGTPISVLRSMMAYGPGQRSDKVVPTIIESLLQNQTARLGSGRRLVDWVYIDDVVDAFVRTGARKPLNGTVDLGSGKLVSIRDCALLIGSQIGRPDLLDFDPSRDRRYEEVKAADTRAAAERLGWHATTSLREGMQKTIAALESRLATSRS